MKSSTYAGFRPPPRKLQLAGQPAGGHRLTRTQCLDLLEDYASHKETTIRRFLGLYDHDRCNTDRQFECRYLDGVDWRHNCWGSRRLTSLLLMGGLEEYDWLMLSESGGSCVGFSATDYDALRYNTEVIITIKFATPAVDVDLGVELPQLSFTIDPTVFTKPRSMLDFLTRSTAVDDPLPFGFTYPQYVTAQQGARGAVLMPRYAISLGLFCTNRLRGQIVVPSQDGRAPFCYNTELMPLLRLRLLLLMWIENALYQAMLPDDYATGPQVVCEAAAMLYRMDCLLRDALRYLIVKLDACGVLGSRARGRQIDGDAISRELVKKWLVDDARAEFAQYVDRHGHCLRLEQEDGDPFVLLVNLAEQLTKLAYAGRLAPYRDLQKRSQSLPFELLFKKK